MNEEDVETIDNKEPEEDFLFENESIIAAANKVLDYDTFKKNKTNY